MSDTFIDEGDFDEDDEDQFPSGVLDQIQRLKLQIDEAEQLREEKRNRAYRMRRSIEEWSDHRMLFDGLDDVDNDSGNHRRRNRSR